MKRTDDIDRSNPQLWANYVCPDCGAHTDGKIGMIFPPIPVGRHGWLYGLVCDECNANLMDWEKLDG